MLLEVYIFFGLLMACLHLWAKKKLDEEIELTDLLVAVITIFLWLPFLLFYAYGWYKTYKQRKKLEESVKEMILKVIEEDQRKREEADKELKESLRKMILNTLDEIEGSDDNE